MCVCEGGHYILVVGNFQDKRLKLHKDQILLASSRCHVKYTVLLHNKKKRILT